MDQVTQWTPVAELSEGLVRVPASPELREGQPPPRRRRLTKRKITAISQHDESGPAPTAISQNPNGLEFIALLLPVYAAIGCSSTHKGPAF